MSTWCLSLASGEMTFHDSPEAATAAAEGKGNHVVWFDSFDYDRHNPDTAATRRYERRIAHERSLGRAYVGVQLDRLCHRYGLPVAVWRNQEGAA